MTDFEKTVALRQSLEMIRDHSMNHVGAIALARHALNIVFDTPATAGRPNPPERMLVIFARKQPKPSRRRTGGTR